MAAWTVHLHPGVLGSNLAICFGLESGKGCPVWLFDATKLFFKRLSKLWRFHLCLLCMFRPSMAFFWGREKVIMKKFRIKKVLMIKVWNKKVLTKKFLSKKPRKPNLPNRTILCTQAPYIGPTWGFQKAVWSQYQFFSIELSFAPDVLPVLGLDVVGAQADVVRF